MKGLPREMCLAVEAPGLLLPVSMRGAGSAMTLQAEEAVVQRQVGEEPSPQDVDLVGICLPFPSEIPCPYCSFVVQPSLPAFLACLGTAAHSLACESCGVKVSLDLRLDRPSSVHCRCIRAISCRM